MVTATFRFYGELNEFLAPWRRGREFASPCARAASTKHMIEAHGVPHTEVELVLVNGESVSFDFILRDGDRVAVYPKFEALDVTPLLRVRERPLRETRFVADAHLGRLAYLLRMTGFDTLYDNAFRDDEIERIAAAQGRIVLTRDRELLKRRAISHGCYLHHLRAEEQFREVFDRLDLARSARPFTLCLRCNAPLVDVDKAQVASLLRPGVCERYERFRVCTACGRIFWEGSHWRRMHAMIDALLAQTAGGQPASAPASSEDRR
jgi:uncharacterized protein with PIN domain